MTIDLQRGRLLRVLDGAGSTLTAHGGEVWITEQDNTLTPSEFTLVEAASDASISFQA